MCSSLLARRAVSLLGSRLALPAECAAIGQTSWFTASAHSIDDPSETVDWTHAYSPRFEIRPSALSPLHAVHRQNEDIEYKRQLVKDQLRAQAILDGELQLEEGQDVMTALANRSEKYAKLLQKYDAMAGHRPLPLCKGPEHMYDYYRLLAGQAQRSDEDADGSFLVNSGQTDVWRYWEQQFADKYAGIPSLEALEVIYNKGDPEAELDELKARAKSAATKSLKVRKISSKPDSGWYASTGKRKTSVACVQLRPGEGRMIVNRVPYDQYFGDITCRAHLLKPLLVTNTSGQYDVVVRVRGGGLSGQAQAVAHGISKAMVRCATCPDASRGGSAPGGPRTCALPACSCTRRPPISPSQHVRTARPSCPLSAVVLAGTYVEEARVSIWMHLV
jgi:ribosomal protein S9